MKKIEQVVIKTEERSEYYCDLCGNKIARLAGSWGDIPTFTTTHLDSVAATKVIGYANLYCRPEFVKAKDDIFELGSPTRDENKEVWERIKDIYPTYNYDCCYECFKNTVVPFLESKKLTK